MATNVYRCEQLTYFCDVPFRQQGYYMSTSSDGVSAFSDESTWEEMEARALKMFPDCDPVRVAGFALIAMECAEWSDYAYEKLEEELNPDGEEGNYDDVLTIVDIAEQIVGDSDEGPEQD